MSSFLETQINNPNITVVNRGVRGGNLANSVLAILDTQICQGDLVILYSFKPISKDDKIEIVNGIKKFILDMFDSNEITSKTNADYMFDLMCTNGYIKNESLFNSFFHDNQYTRDIIKKINRFKNYWAQLFCSKLKFFAKGLNKILLMLLVGRKMKITIMTCFFTKGNMYVESCQMKVYLFTLFSFIFLTIVLSVKIGINLETPSSVAFCIIKFK